MIVRRKFGGIMAIWRDTKNLLYRIGGMILLSFLLGTTARAEEDKYLACYYYDTDNASLNSSIYHAGLPWLWALGSNGEEIIVRGKEKDGFFDVIDIAGDNKGLFSINNGKTYDNSEKAARVLCDNALRDAFPTEYMKKIVLNMAVKSSFLSTNKMAPVFLDQRGKEAPNQINKMVIFGDSLSDTGNLKAWLRMVPLDPYWAGRFTNGKNWVDQFQEVTRISVQNWAVGGSVTHEDMALEKHRCSWEEQVKHKAHSAFSGSVHDEITRYKFETVSNKQIDDPEGTLYTILVGGNDYLSLLNSERDVDAFIDDPDDKEAGSNIINDRVTRNIENHLYALSEIGARNIMVINLPDFGIIPKLLESKNYHGRDNETEEARLVKLSMRLTEIIKNHNRLLKLRVEEFEKRFPEKRIVLVDIFSGLKNTLLSQHFAKPSRFFNYQLDPDFVTTVLAGSNSATINKACYTDKVCPAPDKVLFWDYVHPTTFGHCLLAAEIHQKLRAKGLVSKANFSYYLAKCRPELLESPNN